MSFDLPSLALQESYLQAVQSSQSSTSSLAPPSKLLPLQHTPSQGVKFSIRIEGAEHSCMVASCALKRLYAFEGTTLDIQHVYEAYQPAIHDVARNLILRGKSGSDGDNDNAGPLLVLRAPHFTAS